MSVTKRVSAGRLRTIDARALYNTQNSILRMPLFEATNCPQALETQRMPFRNDAALAADVGSVFGEYVTTFDSEHGQVRADLFRTGNRLEAHVSFRGGIDASTVADRYVSDLWQYAREQGYADRFRMILSEAEAAARSNA